MQKWFKVRESGIATIQGYLEMAEERLKLHEVEESDLEKVLEHLQKAEEELEKQLQ